MDGKLFFYEERRVLTAAPQFVGLCGASFGAGCVSSSFSSNSDGLILTLTQLIWILFHHLNAQEEEMNALESDLEEVCVGTPP